MTFETAEEAIQAIKDFSGQGELLEFFCPEDLELDNFMAWDLSIKTVLGHFYYSEGFFINQVLGNYQIGELV